jgi:Antirepressor regulating drug resistance, predicted signal transduction N-terminal membrane component
MEAFGIYSLKAGIILALFWGIYRLFLHRETFYRFNRFFLLAGLISSLLLPLYTIHYSVEVKAPDIPIHLISASERISSQTESAEIGTSDYSVLIKYFILSLPFIYVSVLCLILFVRFMGFSRLLRIIHRSKHKKYSNYTLIESSEFEGAFSFFSFIILPVNLNESEKNIIVRHEETHIKQNHWIDLLLSNIISLMWWFNPVTRLYEKAIKNNHEYLADKEVLSQYGLVDYQQALVNQWLKTSVFPMTNSFSYSNRLKRIKMMKKNISNPAKRFFSLAAIPAIAVFLCAFAEKEYVFSYPDSQIATSTSSLSGDSLFLYSNVGKVFEDGSMSMFNGEFTVRKISSGLLLEGCDEQPLIVIDDKATNMDIKDVDINNIGSIVTYVSEDAIMHYGEKGKNGAVALTTKTYLEKNLPVAGISSKKENTLGNAKTNIVTPKPLDSASYNFESRAEISIIDSYSKGFIYGGKVTMGKYTSETMPLIIIDGKKESIDIEKIKAIKNHSMSIYGDSAAMEKYGEAAKNGVIEITTYEGRKAKFESSDYDIKGTVIDESGNPVSNALVKIIETETYTDQNGMFTLHIVPGDWLKIEAEGYEKKTFHTDENIKITSAQITLKKR